MSDRIHHALPVLVVEGVGSSPKNPPDELHVVGRVSYVSIQDRWRGLSHATRTGRVDGAGRAGLHPSRVAHENGPTCPRSESID